MRKKQNLLEAAQRVHRDLQEVRRILRKPVETEAARLKLTPPQRSVMQALFYSEWLSLKDLSREVGLAHATVSGIVDRLQKRGLVVRQRDPKDGRVTRILVPESVRKRVREKLAVIAIHPLAKVLKRATPAERKAITEGLRTLRRIIENQDVDC